METGLRTCTVLSNVNLHTQKCKLKNVNIMYMYADTYKISNGSLDAFTN